MYVALLTYVVAALGLTCRECAMCAASGVFVSTFKGSPNFYITTAAIAGITEARQRLLRNVNTSCIRTAFPLDPLK